MCVTHVIGTMSCLLNDVLTSNPTLTHRLIQALRSNDAWKSLHSIVPDSHLSATFSPSSPDDLVLALQNSFVSLQEFVSWLELIDAVDALLLLKPDEPVQIVTHPQSRVVIEAGNVSVLRLTCEATAFPHPNYAWYFNDRHLLHQRGPVLEITPVTEDHAGTYYCLVSNTKGSRVVSATSTVLVVKRDQNNPEEPLTLCCTDKVALLISNSDYSNDVRLKLTVNDVEILAKSLAQLGFRILAFKNLTKCEILGVTNFFCQFLKDGTYSVFYYAGHGFKHRRIDYMQPIDCDSTRSEKCVRFVDIADRIKRTPSNFNLIILDACRNTGGHHTDLPVVEPREVRKARRSSIIVYATSPYNSAVEVTGHQNGLFMEHLKRHIDGPICVHDALRRTLKDLEEHKFSHYQIPVVKYDTPHDHSLSDPILDGEVYRINSELWQPISRLPPDEAFRLPNAVVHVCYSCERDVFCNSLVVEAFREPSHPDVLVSLEALSFDGASVSKAESDSSALVVSSLQRLTAALEFSVVLRNVKTGRIECNRRFTCGYPLVSALQCGT
ncbi:mucosa-associated lymphoid tissue lymphoma translocation protein 1-like [Ornithodoros turicata]|uniref:mucosa-associated lymphoid tissue lymphoma translocation protein 1-like n=1 Tax=Ornithodoros turicata TaxID=34597 RepID=UPI0031388985